MKKFILIFTTALFWNCSDFLKVQPVEDISIEEQLSTLNGTLQALNGAYRSTSNLMMSEVYNMYCEVVSGNASFMPSKANNSNKGTISVKSSIINVYNFDDLATDSDLESFYDGCYQVINNLNLILRYVDGVSDATSQQKNQIKAEALSLRAFVHFSLLRVYSQNYGYTPNATHLGIVYNTQPLLVGVDFPARDNCATSYQKVIDDLLSADALFTGTPAFNFGPPNSYFNRYSAKALLARVYLYAHQWQNAINLASEVINFSGVSLLTQSNYVSQWEQFSPSSEVLLEFSPNQNGANITFSMTVFYGQQPANSSSISLVASSDLLPLFDSNDIRGSSMHILENIQTLNSLNQLELKPYYFSRKYQNNDGAVELRLSEMYLIRSEAHARLGNLTAAVADFNTIHTRAGNTAKSFSTIPQFLDELFKERRRELCYERHLIFDYGRFQKSIDRGTACLSPTICILNYPSPKYILPIPQKNLNLNENLIQNESY